MEKIEINSNVLFSKYKIKKLSLNLAFTTIGIIIFIYLVILLINTLINVNNGTIKNDLGISLYAILYTAIAISFIVSIGLLSLIIVLIILIIRHKLVINYYKKERFIAKQTINFEFDYKLFQTARKNCFYSQAFIIKINDKVIERKTRPIFTNSKKIGLFKINPILQSHTYKKERCVVAYDKEKDEIVVIEI